MDGRFYGDGGTAHDTFLLRRVRPIIEGTVFEKYDYRVMLDFGSAMALYYTMALYYVKMQVHILT